MLYTAQYQFGDYRGNIKVNAIDEEEAKLKVKKQLNKLSSLPMAYVEIRIIKEI